MEVYSKSRQPSFPWVLFDPLTKRISLTRDLGTKGNEVLSFLRLLGQIRVSSNIHMENKVGKETLPKMLVR